MENTRVQTLKQEQQSSWNKKNHWRPDEDLILKKYVDSWRRKLGNTFQQIRSESEWEKLQVKVEELPETQHQTWSWSLIAGRLPGRTDNKVKNYWNTDLNKNSGCCPCPASSTGLSRRKRKTSTAEYTRWHQGRNLCSNKTRNDTGNMTREDILKDETNSKGDDRSSSTIISTTTATSYPINTDQRSNFIYADIDHHQYSPSSSWVQYYLPTITNNATSSSTFLFDDEPLFASMDSILSLEAPFGCTVAASAGMQSSVTMPFSSADDPHSPHF